MIGETKLGRHDSQQLPAEESRGSVVPANSVNFRRYDGTLHLDVGKAESVNSIVDESTLDNLSRHGFIPKEELHITVLNYDNGSRILRSMDGMPEDDREASLGSIEETAHKIDWSWRPTGEVYPFRGKNVGPLKLVALVECPGVSDFYNWVEDLLPDMELARHPMHITFMKKPLEGGKRPNTQIDGIIHPHPLNRLGHLALGY